MRRSARLPRHAVHPVLVIIPIGLFALSVVFDVLALATDQPLFGWVASVNIGAGLTVGVLAAFFGTLDLLAIPARTLAARVGLLHAALNAAMLGLFAASLAVRADSSLLLPSYLAVGLSAAGLALMGVAGFLGSALIRRMGVGLMDADGRAAD